MKLFSAPGFSRLIFSRLATIGAPVALLWLAGNAPAEIILPKIIGDHMVLQRGMKAPIWGTAAPHETISVRGDWQKRAVTTIADADGRWAVKLPVPAPGGPHCITVAGRNEIILHDVLVGEVWICSGQSNMEMPIGPVDGYSGVTNWEEELRHADFPNVRLFTVPNRFALVPQFDCDGGWSGCNAETAKSFSAAGFFFGRELHQTLNVPVGLISADYGGTVCEAWTSAEALEKFPEFAGDLNALANERDSADGVARATAAKISEWSARIESATGAVTNAAPGLDDSSWRAAPMLGQWTGDIQFYQGFVTFRKTFVLPSGWTDQDLVLELGPVDDMDFTYLNGVEIGRTVGELTWSKPRVYDIPKARLRSGKNVLAVCVLNTGGPGGIGGPVRLCRAGETNFLDLDHDWRFQVGTKYSALPQLVLPARAQPNSPSVLFNAMIAPLVPFGIRGAIWYQGESNIGRAEQYRGLFPAMIGDWRRRWGEGDFPFYYVQIAPFHYPNPGMAAALREAQFLSLKTPNTGMAATMDSDSNNLHPLDKQKVGHRLALWALAKTYGRKNLACSGPLYKKMKIERGNIRLFFDCADGGLMARGGRLEHFAIAGADGKFFPATADIAGETILVSSEAVPRPVAARYAWGDGDESSFGNREGLPAPSFRTDAPKMGHGGSPAVP